MADSSEQRATRRDLPAPSGPTVVVLPDTCNISTVATIREDLDGALRSADEVVIDASEVDRVDTAALQLLVVFGIEADRLGRRVRVERPSDAMKEIAVALDLDAQLGFGQVTGARE